MNTYPGWPFMVSGSLTACPPPQECCCEQQWELRPGDIAPRTIEISNWLRQNVAIPANYKPDELLIELKITDLDTPNTSYPPALPAQPPVVLPLVATTQFQITKITAFVDAKTGRQGYALIVDTLTTARINGRFRLDYKFKALSACDGDFIGTGCVLVVIRKCFTGSI